MTAKWKLPPNKDWLVYLEGDTYVFDPWEQQYFLYFREVGVFDFSKEKQKITLAPGKAASGNYYKGLFKVVNEFKNNPKLTIEDLPMKPPIKKQKKKIRKKRGPYKKTIEKEVKRRKKIKG